MYVTQPRENEAIPLWAILNFFLFIIVQRVRDLGMPVC